MAAIDIDRLAGDEITVLGGKEDYGPYQVFRELISLE
jgi:hypothetical protein